MLFVRRVEGDSMRPSLRAGRMVLATHSRKIREGDVVIAFVDGHEVIKRVKHIDRNHGLVDLVSDNPKGGSYNNVADRLIEGRVVLPFVFKRPNKSK